MKNNTAKGRPYPQGTMYSAVLTAAEEKPDSVAYDFQGKETIYKDFIEKINLAVYNIKKGLLKTRGQW